MSRLEVATTAAPAAIGPYSQAIDTGGFVFCSGQLGLDPTSGELGVGVEDQTERALLNLEAVLDAAGLSMADVVKTTVFLADLADFALVNAIYARHVVEPSPARSTVQVAGLPRRALVEIEAIARRLG
ncbi:MAG: RidA family protein [Candidatus Limnocylindrales bacterium]|jgi:2-iminobutanoate/2-iminopropanoate deaminase